MKAGNPTESIPKQQGEEGGFYLIWLASRRLLGEKVRSQGVLFCGFWMGYNNSWDSTTSITAYFTQLDRFQVSLGDRGIATSEDEKTMTAGAQMWNSKMFTKDQMVAWENKTAAQKTWAVLQTYFTNKWLELKQYSAMMAKQSRFKEAALLAQETAAVEEEGESQAMLFAMLQEQHDKQIAVMAATNKANMDLMMEQMNAMVAGR